MKRNKSGLLCLTLVIALGLLGVGSAYWTEGLNIAGTVETGVFEVVFTEFERVEDHPPWVDVQPNEEVLEPPEDSHGFSITTQPWWPPPWYYRFEVRYTVTNQGTIPARFEDSEITASPDPPWLTWLDQLSIGEGSGQVLGPGETDTITATGRIRTHLWGSYTLDATITYKQWNAAP
ncbi:MAG: hypothetical protein U9R11_04250 [Chloroflexota bacterium]|nr:hypothetical protein [Chloroflexota bacterium]